MAAPKPMTEDATVASDNHTTEGIVVLTTPTPRLSAEVRAILEAPVPASEIKSYDGKGGKIMRYTTVKFVEDRIRQVDPDFSCEVAESSTGITVHYIILGVKRGDLFDRDEEDTKYGTPDTNALARAKRRAAKAFGIATELWGDEEAGATPPNAGNSSRAGGHKEPSPAALKMLTDLGVPENIARRLNAWGHGKNPKTGYPFSDASEVIDALKEARGTSKGKVDSQVWKPIVNQYELAPIAGSTDDDEDAA